MWRDPLRLLRLLSADARAAMHTAGTFARRELRPRVRDDYRHETAGRDVMRALGRVGLLGCDDDYQVYGAVAREIERVDSGYRSMLSVQTSLVMRPLKHFGTDAQRAAWLDPLAAGDLVGAFGLTEPGAGSDPAAMQTTARRHADDWVLNGAKAWITNAPIADLLLVWARAPDGIRAFWVERDMPGLETPACADKLAMRASPTGHVFLDDVRTPHALDATPGLSTALATLSGARYGIAWGALGAGQDCYERARHYVMDRSAFGAPLASKQLVQEALADMATDLSTGLAACIATDELAAPGVSLLKRNSTRTALRVARSARELLGGNGISDEYDVMRHAANLEAVHTYEGTAHVHGLILGREITGYNAF